MADPILSLSARLDGEALIVTYEVRNPGATDAYLLNRLFTSAPPRMSPDIVYVALDEAQRLVRLHKGIAEMPAGASGPPVPIAPYVTPLRARSRFTETIRLAVPVRVYREYGRSPPRRPADQERIATFGGLDLRIDWYASAPGVTEAEDTAFGQPVILPTGFRTMPVIHRLQSGIIPLSIPVVWPTG